MVKRIERLQNKAPSSEVRLLMERSQFCSDSKSGIPANPSESSVAFALLGTLFVFGWLLLCFVLRLSF